MWIFKYYTDSTKKPIMYISNRNIFTAVCYIFVKSSEVNGWWAPQIKNPQVFRLSQWWWSPKQCALWLEGIQVTLVCSGETRFKTFLSVKLCISSAVFFSLSANPKSFLSGLILFIRPFISALFPENLNSEKKGRPTTAGSKIKVSWGCWFFAGLWTSLGSICFYSYTTLITTLHIFRLSG